MAKFLEGRLADVSGKAVNIDPATHYDGWAASYDKDLLEEYGYSAPRIAAEALDRVLPDRNAVILDVGCGTGLVGKELANRGFSRFVGVDVSPGMLAEAEKTGLYEELILADAEAEGPGAQDAYDAVISVGSFGLGHLGPEAMAGLARCARPGGPVVIFMNAEPFADQDYAGTISAMKAEGLWNVTGISDHNYMDALNRPGKLIVANRA